VESIPQKMEQNRPKTAILNIVVREFGHRIAPVRPPIFYEAKVSKNQVKFGHRVVPFGHRIWQTECIIF